MAAFFGERFNSRRVQQAAGVTVILGLGGYLLVVTQGAAILLSDLTDMSFHQSLLVAWLSYTLFTMYAGSRGVIVTDTMMFVWFSVASVAFVAIVLADLGGPAAAVEALTRSNVKPDITAWHGTIGPGTRWPTALDFLIWALVIDICWSVVFAVSPWQASRHLMARDEHVVVRSSIYTCFAVIVIQLIIYGVGGIINLLNPGISPSETVIIWAAHNRVPEVLGAVLLAGIMAAALSSASTFLSLVGFSVSNDVPKQGFALTLGKTRVAVTATGLLVLAASYMVPPNIFEIMVFIVTVFASSWGPVGFMSVWSKRITADGAFWGIICGFLGNVVPAMMQHLGLVDLPSYLDPAILGGAAGLAAIVLASWRGSVTPQEAEYRERLHRVPAADRDMRKALVSMLPSALLTVYGLVMPFVMLKWYVIPYQAGAGQLLPDGSVNWAGAEALIAFGSMVFFVPLGVISTVVIWRRYRPLSD